MNLWLRITEHLLTARTLQNISWITEHLLTAYFSKNKLESPMPASFAWVHSDLPSSVIPCAVYTFRYCPVISNPLPMSTWSDSVYYCYSTWKRFQNFHTSLQKRGLALSLVPPHEKWYFKAAVSIWVSNNDIFASTPREVHQVACPPSHDWHVLVELVNNNYFARSPLRGIYSSPRPNWSGRPAVMVWRRMGTSWRQIKFPCSIPEGFLAPYHATAASFVKVRVFPTAQGSYTRQRWKTAQGLRAFLMVIPRFS